MPDDFDPTAPGMFVPLHGDDHDVTDPDPTGPVPVPAPHFDPIAAHLGLEARIAQVRAELIEKIDTLTKTLELLDRGAALVVAQAPVAQAPAGNCMHASRNASGMCLACGATE